ncbi:nascent polypeptide-associated complex subunit alpha, muscle-specific form-like isoform X2 [Eurytemora carolleeae]|uniref:nascent polypeptide-associated complex subunit alpha, muscle-specific form-like isoform X2 n=1 Tax=Eurytemora carolleeae TaxID=1294199 RepID=UPI000C7922FE|nr:nascent polypeptide-associated complex subunit alpha, muscle-specific form-like isoform X2 [Eurytemora carolleeae]|eukprot:XP_023341007.1 nascent polypeptide-associated complex subunit alpha, muscle-specific form-like isoform X2 [Eurytemora affinis]
MAAEVDKEGTCIDVSCGVEVGKLKINKFSSGGTSRCIEHSMVPGFLLNPIEFAALGGKSQSWKIAIKHNGKQHLSQLLEKRQLVSCPRKCACENCEFSRDNPTNLEYVFKCVYGKQGAANLKSQKASKVEPPLIDLEDGLTDEFLTSPDLQEETEANQPSQGVDKSSEKSGKSVESWKKKKEKMKDVKVTRKKKSIEPVVKKEKLESSLSMSPSRSKPGTGGQLSGTPESKRKQRDIRSFFSAGATDSSTGAAVSEAAVTKKSPVKLRFEGGAAARINSTDELLKKDLAGMKVINSEDASLYLKDEFEKSADDISIVEEIVNEQIKEKTVNPRKRRKDISEVTVVPQAKLKKGDSSPKTLTPEEPKLKPSRERKRSKESSPKQESPVEEKKGVKRKRTPINDEETTVKVVKVKAKSESDKPKKNSPVASKESPKSKPIEVKKETVSPKSSRPRTITPKPEIVSPQKISVKPLSALRSPSKMPEITESSAKSIISPIKDVNSTVRIIHSPAKPVELTNGHASPTNLVVTPSSRTRKIRKEEFVLFPGYRGREESQDGERTSPSKPPYTAMIRQALLEMNRVGGEGCTKLEILLFVLRKYKPKENITHVTNKLLEVLELGIKKGLLLSSASCTPRKRKDLEPNPEPPSPDKPTHAKPSTTKPEPVRSKSKPTSIKPNPAKSKKVLNSKSEKKPVTVKKEPGTKEQERKRIGVTPKRLLEPLATICKAKKMSRNDALKKTWLYIHEKKLHDPSDKTRIICDAKLRQMTKCKAITSKALLGFIKFFMEPL